MIGNDYVENQIQEGFLIEGIKTPQYILSHYTKLLLKLFYIFFEQGKNCVIIHF